MGEVYKARDARLDRTVAIKVLPDHIAQRDELRQRFEREARAVASLNHPHICTLHDIGPGYMVMELVDGETLASRVAKGALPLEQALKYAAQIADALDRAHRAGVTHRDIKPQNIMLTRDGVKVLDFGLAKSSAKAAASEASNTLTQAAVLTAEGTVLGTPQYMAPELFEGREADARADVWAFGAVLYEMVTGRKAFQGKTYTSLVGAILSAEPAPMAVQPITPAWLERLVLRCLAKDPDDRWQSMRDIVLELRQPFSVEGSAPATPAPSRWPWLAAAGACLILGVAAGGLWMASESPSAPAERVEFEVHPPAGSQFSPIVDGGGSAISPDGRTLAYVAISAKGETLLHLRSLDSRAVRTLPGTEGAARPFWSPDTKSLAFVAHDKLKRIDVGGGLPAELGEVRFPRGGAWNKDGVILYADQASPIRRIPAAGGVPEDVTAKSGGISSHYYPQFLADGKRFLYLKVEFNPATGERKAALYLGSLDRKESVLITETAYKALYDRSSGHLLYMREPGKLLAQKLELDPPRLTGEPRLVANGVGVTNSNRFADFSVSSDGTLFFGQRQGAGQLLQFGWRDRLSPQLQPLGPPVPARLWFALAPDARRFVYYADAGGVGGSDLWVMDVSTGLRSRLTRSGGRVGRWSPDGEWIYFEAQGGIHRKASDGSAEAELVFDGGRNLFLRSVSPDGRFLLYGDRDIMALSLTQPRTAKPYLNTKAAEDDAVFSPDGKWVAYESDETGRHEIYVQAFPEPRAKWTVSADGGRRPRWRADGREIYWVRPDGMLMAAQVTLSAASVTVGRAEPLLVVSDVGGIQEYQPAPDGRRFLVLETPEGVDAHPPMVVMRNWAAGLPD